MTEFVKTVSHLIEDQFPDIYREEGPELVEFIKTYYEYLEQDSDSFLNRGKSLPEINDIDETLSEFVDKYKQKYLADFPFIKASDTRFMVKHISDYYRSKGSVQGLKLLMQMLYGQEVSVYNPSDNIFSASSSDWFVPMYIEVSTGPRNNSFLDQEIIGAKSNARAFVEGIVTKRINGKYIDVMYLSNIRGTFINGEFVAKTDGILTDAPQVIGSLSDVKISLGGRNNTIGDIFDIISENGKQGKIRVTSVEDATGRVDFNIISGGSGYTLTDTTDIYISDAVIKLDNPEENFIEFEQVRQPLETIQTLSSTDINSTWAIGDYVVGFNGANSQVANGIIVSVANTDSEGLVIGDPSANSNIKVIVTEGTFANQISVDFTSPTTIEAGEIIEEESAITLTVNQTTGTFQIGEDVTQELTQEINGKDYIISRAIGEVSSANTTHIELDNAFGQFLTDVVVTGETSGAVTTITNVNVTQAGARGRVSAKTDTDTLVVEDIFGLFNVGNKVQGNKSLKQSTIQAINPTGASDIRLNNVMTSNGVVDVVSNNYVTAMVIGQNTSSLGVHGNTTPFVEAPGAFLETQRELLISPPRNANGTIVEIKSSINELATGASADFKIGSLENEETLTINTDMIGANNFADVKFTDVRLNGANSGVGFLDSITITDGGTLYSNGSIVTFTGGGYASGNPYSPARGIITTDGVGTITAITVDRPGQGYFESPTINMPTTNGTTAIVSPNMDYGYGFVKNPDGDDTNFIGDLLTFEDFTIGTISSMTRINPGKDYNVDPFVSVYNPYIASFNRGDFLIQISNLRGSFKKDEILSQDIGNNNFAKGKVISANTSAIICTRTSFNVSFTDGIDIVGGDSGSLANVEKVLQIENDNIMGYNADITGTVIAANGIATATEVIDSGFGYIEGETLELQNANTVFIMEGIADISRQGIGEGYWRSESSQLSSRNKIHDSDYYQEFSYDILSGQSLDRYEKILKKIMHVAGTKMFGSVVRISKVGEEPTAKSNISTGPLV